MIQVHRGVTIASRAMDDATRMLESGVSSAARMADDGSLVVLDRAALSATFEAVRDRTQVAMIGLLDAKAGATALDRVGGLATRTLPEHVNQALFHAVESGQTLKSRLASIVRDEA